MKKTMIIMMAAIMAASAVQAQVTVSEPEFVGQYCILTSDSTSAILPRETGSITKHETKAKGVLSKVGKVANFAGAAGALGAVVGVHTGNLSGAISAAKTASTAAHVADVASTASALAGAVGMDIVFKGKTSDYKVPAGETVRLIIKGEDNERDPMGIYRVVRFNVQGKERRVQWMELEPSVLGTEEAENFLQFEAHKYGEQSYLLTLAPETIKEGEYGIFYMDLASAMAIPVGTFSVK